MNSSLPGKWRYNIVFGILAILCLCLVGQLAVMLYDAAAICDQMEIAQGNLEVPLPGRPGNISIRTKDRSETAATSDQVPVCFADPSMLDNEKLVEVVTQLGEVLHLNPVDIQNDIIARRDNAFTWLKPKIIEQELQRLELLNLPKDFRDIPKETLPATAEKVASILAIDPQKAQEAFQNRRQAQFVIIKKNLSAPERDGVVKLVKEKRIKGVGVRYEWRRHYPNGDLASAIIGYRYKDNTPAEGIELMLAKELAAQSGKLENLADAGRRPIMPLPERTVEPKDGHDVYLTIDSVIQKTLETSVAGAVDKFGAKWGVGIVMDVHTGEVLAMTSMPTFDPNKFNAVPNDIRKNRCLVDPYEPGSAFKSIIAALAVDAGIATWNTKFYCEGGTYNAPNGGRISDHGASYGWLTLAEIIVHSSNVGMAKLGEKSGNDTLYDWVTKAGFGQRTHIQLPGETSWPGETPGIVTPKRSMDGYSLRRVPFGQQISVTAMQLANAYCALSNGGELLQPRLVDKVCDASGKVIWQSERKVVRRLISPQTSRSAIDVMQQVVEGEGGTGKACKSDLWTTFGKTGTAQIAKNGIYQDRAFTGTFIGGAPASNPRLICLVSIYWPTKNGHYGATVAAPAVKEVLEKSLSYLEVPPDRPPVEHKVAAAH